MLYDPKWEKKTKADPFTLESLIAWLEKQPRDTVYCYSKSRECLLTAYFTACGFKKVGVNPYNFHHNDGTGQVNIKLPDHFDNIAYGRDGQSSCTFGAALSRARALAKASP